MNDLGRAIEPADRAKILRVLSDVKRGSFVALRDRAIVITAWGSALRLSEVLALDLDQILEDPRASTLGRLRGTVYMRGEQTKGRRKGPRRWNSAGTVVLPKRARLAIREYLNETIKRGWLTLPAPRGTPVFLAIKHGRANRDGVRKPLRSRLGKRAAQRAWQLIQLRAGLLQLYRFHDLRHDSLTRVGHASKGNPFVVAQFGRLKDIKTALRYVHGSVATLTELGELSDREP